ncbi:MAG TPA: protein-methionine-sulfoxide reductase catalytic subunit MsrP [Alphaproteobacteria bacterium]|nr:protein-methionine-sulfoxide reductase catalytic subunit MsrP [Alphaproteobacteria bacterium]HBC53364.1 protein-methionine-sulfoxide reductase catalytic subunit MsrP [Alphaproteobacteria bacterium]
MLIKMPKSWEISENRTTPETVFANRRAFMRGVIGAATIAGTGVSLGQSAAYAATDDDTMRYPAPRNPAFQDADRPITDEKLASTYNNFYEFASHKQIWQAAQALPTDPWTIKIDGLVTQPRTIDFDDLLRKIPIEERIYRHRCVERWSMTVPWSGFPMRKLVDLAEPLAGAKFVRFETFHNPEIASGQRQFWYPWPYVEGITLAEAQNDLTFLVTGAYGKPLAKQFGAPLRLALPWKYGFKSIKSIVRISFTDERPVSFWEQTNNREYGFWANVNPNVPHPRWSQAVEEPLGSRDRVPTLLFNGYEEQVAELYKGMSGRSLFM